MTNTNPVTCAEVGHCISPDGDDTCMRCGADAPQRHPALGLEPLNIKATVTDEFGTYPYEYWQKKHAKPVTEPSYEEKLRDELAKELFLILVKSIGYSPVLHGVCFDHAYNFMTERAKRMAARKAGG